MRCCIFKLLLRATMYKYKKAIAAFLALLCISFISAAKDADELDPYQLDSDTPTYNFQVTWLPATTSTGIPCPPYPPVEVTGRLDRRTTVCKGSSCIDLFEDLHYQSEVARLQEISRLIGIPPESVAIVLQAVKLSACSGAPGILPQSKNVTSSDIDVLRWQAATNIIDSIIP
jgi:hypothetical protein